MDDYDRLTAMDPGCRDLPEAPLAEAVRKLLASRWVQATVSALSNMAMDSQAGRTELAVQEAIFVELRDALKAYDSR